MKTEKLYYVYGLGLSGISTCEYLIDNGYQFVCWDDNIHGNSNLLDKGYAMVSLPEMESVEKLRQQIKTIVVSPGIPPSAPIYTFAKKYNIEIVCDVNVFFQNNNLKNKNVIGVTGTNGKTTVTKMFQHILGYDDRGVEIGGNIGIPMLTVPETDNYVIELSSYQLEIAPDLHTNYSVILNISPDHLGRYEGNMDKYMNAKENIFINQGKKDFSVISMDDAYCLKIIKSLKNKRKSNIITISTKNQDAMYYVIKKGNLFEIYYNQKLELIIQSAILPASARNMQNMIACYAVCHKMGVNNTKFVAALQSFPPMLHRQEIFLRKQEISYMNDSKSTNVNATLNMLESYQHKNIYLILGGQAKEGDDFELLRQYIATEDNVKGVFIYGESGSNIYDVMHNMTHIPVQYSPEFETVVKNAHDIMIAQLQQNNSNEEQPTLLALSPACASFGQFQNYEKRGDMFRTLIANLTDTDVGKQKKITIGRKKPRTSRKHIERPVLRPAI